MLFRKMLILGVIGALVLESGITVNVFADSTPVPTPETPATFVTYLPIMISSGFHPPAYPSPFGAELLTSVQNSLITNLAAFGGTWTRNTVLEWSAIEPNPPINNQHTYLWNKVNSGKETELAIASANGVNVIATVKFTPSWAQKYPGSICGPIHPNNLDEFAQFMAAAVARYSVPPYNIKYWEIGNEPDVTVYSDASNNWGSVFGCWGDASQPTTFGGGYYADMLKVVSPAIKTVDPNAKVVIGGLLLDCDPTHPPAGKTCASANFFEGILANGGANFFDYVSFHGYAYYWPGTSSQPPEIVDDTNPNWFHRGGIVVGKIDFLRSVMARYFVNKPIIHSEAALTCPEWFSTCLPPPASFYEAQADYVVRLNVRNIALGVVSTLWFTLEGPGWRYAGLFYDTSTTPKPAYNALGFLTKELSGAAYIGTVNQFTGVWGYEFLTATKRIWVLGGDVGSTVTLPAGWQKVYDKYGTGVIPIGNQVFVKSPFYVEFAP